MKLIHVIDRETLRIVYFDLFSVLVRNNVLKTHILNCYYPISHPNKPI